MKIKHFIVTYKNDGLLQKCIDSIFQTPTDHEREVIVIANHSGDIPNPQEGVKVLRNDLRPDFSTGHLSRNWNQALINGFVSLKEPKADLVVCCQNDTRFARNYLAPLLDLHQKLDLVTFGAGDNCVSYTPNAVIRVGLWDERFCNIGFQEADYFLRCAKYLGDRASVNDTLHKRVHNGIANPRSVVLDTVTGSKRRDSAHLASTVHHKQSETVFRTKWGIAPENWAEDVANTQERIMNHIYYPYFEMDVETLREQNYLIP